MEDVLERIDLSFERIKEIADTSAVCDNLPDIFSLYLFFSNNQK